MLKIGESGEAYKKGSKNLLGKCFWRTFLQNRVISVFFAGTYINMQDAYAVERGTNWGTWQQIGYTGPGSVGSKKAVSAIFTYEEGDAAPQWNVKTNQKLNDCGSGVTGWTLSAKMDENNATTGQSNVLYKAGGQSKCYDLTPSFFALTSGRNY